ncbi:hypothetical protein N7523_005755 [Penicillium sp. IBT 18751x]|nr:hypothetical protein N7523_005653 [Penicillium sp. IBT 18751x]KAJ6118004.1 hypothetical protein N7523_005755 [Penicillium sp. IBT 18751x]
MVESWTAALHPERILEDIQRPPAAAVQSQTVETLWILQITCLTHQAFAERSLLLQQNRHLFQQNNEKKSRQRTKLTVVGKAKIMTFEDITIAKRKREEKEAAREAKKRKKSAVTSETDHI